MWLTWRRVLCGVCQVAHDQDDDPSNAAHKTLDTPTKDDKNHDTVSTHTHTPSPSAATCLTRTNDDATVLHHPHTCLLSRCVSPGHPCHGPG